jgi:hypothetical protein
MLMNRVLFWLMVIVLLAGIVYVWHAQMHA